MNGPLEAMGAGRRFGRLVSFGTVVIDIVAYVDRLPSRGRDILARQGLVEAGGARNVLAAAARQGLPGAYAGVTGTGPMGEIARRALALDRIELLQLPDPVLDTGVSMGLVEPDGERSFVTIVGAEGRLDIRAARAVPLSPDDLLHISGYTLQHEANREAVLDLLRRIGPESNVLYDPGPLGRQLPREVRDEVEARCGWWSGNAEEAQTATGRDDTTAAARSLAEAMPQAYVVVREGRLGCLVSSAGHGVVRVQGFPARAIDTSGAGDTHLGAFAAALAGGLDQLDAARRANAAAALSVTRHGPAAAPTATEVDEFLRAFDSER